MIVDTRTELAARFAAAGDREPLSALCPADRDELAAVLGSAASFEDLPGRWQAALLAAEAGAPAARHCCGGH